MSVAQNNSERENGAYWWLWYAIACVPMLGFWMYGLFDVDEGFYAAVTSEMLRRGDWITPHYNGAPWFEKPILMYWFAAPSVSVFGELVGPRLPSVLATWGLILICGLFARRNLGEAAGRWSMIALGACLITAAVGRMMLADPLLVLFLSAGLICWWKSLTDGLGWRLLAGACIGVAVLAKGPVAILLFGGVWMWTLWKEPDLRKSILSFQENSCAFVLMILMIGIWYVPCWIANGRVFVDEFLIAQNIGRFTGGDQAHKVPIWSHPIYFPVILAVGLLPWWPLALRKPTAEAPSENDDATRRFLWRWFWVVLVFFTISGTKLPHYIYPAVPPIALLIGLRLARRERSDPPSLMPAVAVLFSAALCAGVNLLAMSYYFTSGQEEAHTLARWLRSQTADVAAYQIGRRSADRGTGSLKLMETSLPSMVYYANRDIPQIESLDSLVIAGKETLIFTRVGRITDDDVQRAKNSTMGLDKATNDAPNRKFEIWRIHPFE